jgi:hypothetical protein
MTSNININSNSNSNSNSSIYNDTSSILYNYAITRTLFDSKNKNAIENEITKLLLLQFDLIVANSSNNPAITAKDNLDNVIRIFFKDVINEQGQVGVPLVKINGSYQPVKTLGQLKDVILKYNFREKMSILRNFASKTNDCFMYSILIEYYENRESGQTGQTNAFKTKYPMLNTTFLDESILLIENILGFDIIETANCYQDLRGSGTLITSGCTEKKRFYREIQSDYIANKTQSPITLCWLWHPLVYGVPYQDVVKLPADNYVKKLSTSYTGNNTTLIPNCMSDIYSKYPLFPPLSEREQMYIKDKGGNVLVDGLYQRPPWTPPICYMKPIEPYSFSVNLQKRYKKYSVSNLSGHVMIFLIMAKYFKNPVDNQPINMNMIVLASILFMVPYNHSIHEIFQAAKMMGVNTNYSIKNTDLDNINMLLSATNLTPIVLPNQASWVSPQKRNTFEGTYTKGGKSRMQKQTRRIKKSKQSKQSKQSKKTKKTKGLRRSKNKRM